MKWNLIEREHESKRIKQYETINDKSISAKRLRRSSGSAWLPAGSEMTTKNGNWKIIFKIFRERLRQKKWEIEELRKIVIGEWSTDDDFWDKILCNRRAKNGSSSSSWSDKTFLCKVIINEKKVTKKWFCRPFEGAQHTVGRVDRGRVYPADTTSTYVSKKKVIQENVTLTHIHSLSVSLSLRIWAIPLSLFFLSFFLRSCVILEKSVRQGIWHKKMRDEGCKGESTVHPGTEREMEKSNKIKNSRKKMWRSTQNSTGRFRLARLTI